MSGADIASALSERGVRLRRYSPGATVKVPCPRAAQCGARDKLDPCLSVTIDDDGMGATWRCHRGSCGGWSDGVRLAREPAQLQRRKMRSYRRPPEPSIQATPEELYRWFEARGISRQIVDRRRIFLTKRYFPKLEREVDAICFPYRRRGVLANAKYRALADKAFTQEKDAEKILYGLDDIEGFEWCVIVEGELDALALEAAGISNVLSVPDGAPEIAKDGVIDPENDAKFSFVWNCEAELAHMKRIVLAVDSDQPGRALEEELSRRFGRERVYRARWPTLIGDVQVKDANECLIECGAETVRQCIHQAEPWPIKNLYGVSTYREKVLSLFRGERDTGLTCGLPAIDRRIRLTGTGLLIVVTGIPGHGKSEFIDQMIISMARRHEWRTALCSFESPPERHIAKLSEKVVAMPFFDGPRRRMGESDLNRAMDWLDGRVLFMRADDESPTIDWILDQARVAVVRFGIKLLVIDPYNEVEAQRPDRMSETEYVSSMLGKLKRFGANHGTDIIFVAHPQKMGRREDGSEPVPQLSDISGSAHWFNKADFGLVVWRNRQNPNSNTLVYVRKVKWKDLGEEGTAELAYDRATGIYSELAPTPQSHQRHDDPD